MKTVSEAHSKEILKEMCRRVGANYELFDFACPNWFRKHSWTAGEEQEFILWLADFLEEKKYFRKGAKGRFGMRSAEYEAQKFNCYCGWKTRDVEALDVQVGDKEATKPPHKKSL